MKFSKWIVITALLAVMPLIYSCMDVDNNDSFNDYPNGSMSVATIHLISADSPQEFYFQLDNNKTLYPTIRTAPILSNYTAVEGQRVFVSFYALESIPGYDYSGNILALENIITKDIIPLTEATADSIGNDRINATAVWLTDQSYLNIECQFYTTGKIKHMLNLVMDETQNEPKIDDEGYIHVQFRHNAFNDNSGDIRASIVSFKLEKIANLIKEGAKGLKIKVNTIYNGTEEYVRDFKEKGEETKTFTNLQSRKSALTTNIIY